MQKSASLNKVPREIVRDTESVNKRRQFFTQIATVMVKCAITMVPSQYNTIEWQVSINIVIDTRQRRTLLKHRHSSVVDGTTNHWINMLSMILITTVTQTEQLRVMSSQRGRGLFSLISRPSGSPRSSERMKGEHLSHRMSSLDWLWMVIEFHCAHKWRRCIFLGSCEILIKLVFTQYIVIFLEERVEQQWRVSSSLHLTRYNESVLEWVHLCKEEESQSSECYFLRIPRGERGRASEVNRVSEKGNS